MASNPPDPGRTEIPPGEESRNISEKSTEPPSGALADDKRKEDDVSAKSNASAELVTETRSEEYSFLVEENCAWFRDLLNAARQQFKTKTDLFCLYLHSFMLELGFVGELSQDEVASFSWRKPAGWFLDYRLSHESSNNNNLRFRLSIFQLGPGVTKVHGLSLSDKTAYFTTKLAPSEFVEGGGEENSCWRLRNVSVLARLFKNEVGYPLLQTGRHLAGQQSGGLLCLPPELALTVIFHLDARSVVRLGASCKQMDQLCRTESVWQRLARQDFKKTQLRSFVKTWRDFYKILKEEKKSLASQRTRIFVGEPLSPPFSNPFGVVPEPEFPTAFPGVIGGDYDIFPQLPRGFGPQFGPRRGGFGGGRGPDLFGRPPQPRFGGNLPGFGWMGGGGFF